MSSLWTSFVSGRSCCAGSTRRQAVFSPIQVWTPWATTMTCLRKISPGMPSPPKAQGTAYKRGAGDCRARGDYQKTVCWWGGGVHIWTHSGLDIRIRQFKRGKTSRKEEGWAENVQLESYGWLTGVFLKAVALHRLNVFSWRATNLKLFRQHWQDSMALKNNKGTNLRGDGIF